MEGVARAAGGADKTPHGSPNDAKPHARTEQPLRRWPACARVSSHVAARGHPCRSLCAIARERWLGKPPHLRRQSHVGIGRQMYERISHAIIEAQPPRLPRDRGACGA